MYWKIKSKLQIIIFKGIYQEYGAVFQGYNGESNWKDNEK